MKVPKIKLQSKDGQEFVMDVDVAYSSKIITTILEDLGLEHHEDGEPDDVGRIEVKGEIFELVLSWMEHHKNDPRVDGVTSSNGPVVISEWDADFMAKMDQETFFDVVLAANFLDIKPLFDVCCQKIANSCKGKTSEEIRNLYITTRGEPELIKLSEGDAPQVKLKSSDGALYSVDKDIAMLIPTLKVMLENKGEEVIALPMAYSSTLEKIIKWVQHHKNDDAPAPPPEPTERINRNTSGSLDDVEQWDLDFLNEDLNNPGDLFEVAVLARKLTIKGLEDLIAKKFRNIFMGRTTDEIRAILRLPDDLTEEQKHFIPLENKWVEHH
ncbi:S-phase kinase-associated protein 1 [Orchesella cincta]|uniref:S-phase kinase-associated protein 1 n=1 Tax=Orchesella cincta TaxID=48709 RepID=A0A1D2MHV9_ORCCI|nr:S-phase kinase-associated protein 1 [Orchesella cincta]